VDALGRSGTVLVLLAFDRCVAAIVVRISDCSKRAHTFVRSPRIVTMSSWRARVVGTEIDEFAALLRVSGVTRLAEANLAVILS